MDEFRQKYEKDLAAGEFGHLDTPTLYKYLARVNKSARGSNPAFHAKMNHAGETIRFLIGKRENDAQQAHILKWTKAAAIAAVLAVILGILGIVLQWWS